MAFRMLLFYFERETKRLHWDEKKSNEVIQHLVTKFTQTTKNNFQNKSTHKRKKMHYCS